MHPDLRDAEVGTLAHRVLGDLGSRSDDDRLDAPGIDFRSRIGRISLDLVGVWADREHLIATSSKPLVDVAAVVFGVRDTPVTAIRLLARNAAAASFMVCMAPPFYVEPVPDARTRGPATSLGESTGCCAIAMSRTRRHPTRWRPC